MEHQIVAFGTEGGNRVEVTGDSEPRQGRGSPVTRVRRRARRCWASSSWWRLASFWSRGRIRRQLRRSRNGVEWY